MRRVSLSLAFALTAAVGFAACGDDTGDDDDDDDDDDDIVFIDAAADAPGDDDDDDDIDAPTGDASLIDGSTADASLIDGAISPDGPGPGVDASLIDGAIGTDAPLNPCDPVGDFVEADDAGNDPFEKGSSLEASGQQLTTTSFTIGGCVDPEFATPDRADGDGFFFEIGGVDPVILGMRLTSPQGAGANGTTVLLADANTGNGIAIGTLVDGVAEIAPVRLDPDFYILAVFNNDTGLVDPHTYQVTIEALVCDPVGGAADYTEANDGALHRSNDMLEFDYSTTTLTPTALATDDPEVSGIASLAGMTYKIAGNSGDTTVNTDEYLDHDTFAFTASAPRAFFIVSWSGTANDLDILVTEENAVDFDTGVVGGGLAGGGTEDFGGAGLSPGDTYWLWVANYTGSDPGVNGLPYTITACFYE